MSVVADTNVILEDAARDGSIAIEEWPRVLESVLQKLHDIVHTDFPIPQPPISNHFTEHLPSDIVSSTPPQLPSSESAEEITKITPEPTESTIFVQQDTLPPELLSSLQSSIRILERYFAQSPPYTVQRLAELVLQPRRHYKYLPAYLRALDRVVSVSSPISDFPLPAGISNGTTTFLTNGDLDQLNGIQEREGLGSDESLGGALLTPISWLRNNALTQQPDGEFHSERMDTILGPNGAGSVETVSVTINGISSSSAVAHTSPNTSTPASPTLSEQSDASTNSSGSISTEAQLREQGGVTQGELLRQEQEAGVIPVAQTRHLQASESIDAEEDVPHARGPEEIGMEDTGLVQGANSLDMAAAAGRGQSKSPQPPAVEEAEQDQEHDAQKSNETDEKDHISEKDNADTRDSHGADSITVGADDNAATDSGAAKDKDGDMLIEDVDDDP